MSFTDVHARLANTVLYYAVALAVWSWWRFARRQGISPSYWGALAVFELLLMAQGGLGAYLWLSGLRPERTVHVLYGVVSMLMIPGVYAYTHGREERSETLIHAAATLVLIGLILRAVVTAG